MTISHSLALALIAGAGIAGAFIGRAMPRDAPSTQAALSGSPAPLATEPAGYDCKAEHAELAKAKTQLAICTAFMMGDPETTPSDVPEKSTPDPPALEPAEVRRNRELLDDDSEAVIVRRADGTIGIYEVDEWPNGVDGLLIGRKFPDGKLGWYSRPIPRPSSDSAAPQRNPPIFVGSNIRLQPDMTLTVHGKPAPPEVQRRLGGKVDEAAKP